MFQSINVCIQYEHDIPQKFMNFRVDSCPCYFPNIESVPTSEFGATTDVRQAAGYDFWLAAVLTLSARIRHPPTKKNDGQRLNDGRRSGTCCSPRCDFQKSHAFSIVTNTDFYIGGTTYTHLFIQCFAMASDRPVCDI